MRIYKVWIDTHAAVEVLMHANNHIDFCGVIDTKGQLRSNFKCTTVERRPAAPKHKNTNSIGR